MTSSRETIALFNHGGGMRGLIPAHVMTRIEETTGLHMAEMVDIFAGPSTGAILNAGLNVPHPREPRKPRFRARHLVRFYEREGHKIFPPDRFREFRGFIHDFNNRTMKIGQLNRLMRHGHYDPGHLSRSLKAMYGDFKLCDTLRSLIVPVYNIDGESLRLALEENEGPETPAPTRNNFRDDGGHAVWLKNVKGMKNDGCTADVYLRDAVLASAAAPSYFPCHHFAARFKDGPLREYTGIDGSIFDNACVSWHGAIRSHVPENSRVTMIALGTGYTLRSYKKEEWNRFGGLGVVDPVNDLPLINILFHASESALLESFGDELGDNLYVFNKRLFDAGDESPSAQIDDASPENLQRLRRFAEELIEDNQSRFDQLCHRLASNRDARQKERRGKSLAARLKYFLAKT